MEHTINRPLTAGQRWVLALATLPMIGTGVAGGLGTYSNMTTAFGRSETALGIVAAGEGATFVLAVVMVALTMLGQSSPTPVRIGLWTLPVVASVTGAMVAPTVTEAVIFAVTPLAMCVSAEGVGLVARRIVVYRTGVDAEADRRNADTMRRLAYHRAASQNHPDEKVREKSERAAWKLAARVGVGDSMLGAGLVTVQRDRMTGAADDVLADMFTLRSVTATVTGVTPPVAAPSEPVKPVEVASSPAPTPQVSPGLAPVVPPIAPEAIKGPEPEAVTAPVTPVTAPVTAANEGETDTDEDADEAPAGPTLEELATVADVPVPVPGEALTDAQILVALRHLRHSVNPPMSYRRASVAFRAAGFVGSEARTRRAWSELEEQEADLF